MLQLLWAKDVCKISRLVVGCYDHDVFDTLLVAKMWGKHVGEWGCSGWVEEQILEARLLEVLRAGICRVIWDLERERVCPWGRRGVSLGEARCEERLKLQLTK
jgi:hypothetical protein